MLSLAEAEHLVSQHLSATPRAAHSRFVAHVMRQLADRLGADGDLWEIVGLCHDLDFFKTCDDRSQHGLLTITVSGWATASRREHLTTTAPVFKRTHCSPTR
jgi:predicted hydrolase (HD superfamily)